MRSKLMHAIGWLTAGHCRHFEAQRTLMAEIGAFFMRLAHREEFDYHQAAYEQQIALTELKALSAALEIKDLASLQGGWDDHHGIGLDMVGQVLMEQTEWEPEDVHDFVFDLSDGFFDFGPVYEDDLE